MRKEQRKQVSTDTNRHKQSIGDKGSLYNDYAVSQTAHPGLLICPSSPSRCSPSEGVKGWQVPGGAARSLWVRFLRGQAVMVLGWNERGGDTTWLVSIAGDRRDHIAAVSPNQLHYQTVTDSHACPRRPQSAFRALPSAHHKSIILQSLIFGIFNIKSMIDATASAIVQCICVISNQTWLCYCETVCLAHVWTKAGQNGLNNETKGNILKAANESSIH